MKSFPCTWSLHRDISGRAPVDAMRQRFAAAGQQLEYFYEEMSGGKTGWRGLVYFFSSFARANRLPVAAYRCKRFWWLLLGRWHAISLLFMWPLYVWFRQLGGHHEISPRARIGPGFRIIHCSRGCVISPFAAAGKNLYLTGGNVIGRRRVHLKTDELLLGDDVMLGIGAIVIGPLKIHDGVRVGAGTTVVKDVPAGATVVGGPVRHLFPEIEE